jgi:hypothetical protein
MRGPINGPSLFAHAFLAAIQAAALDIPKPDKGSRKSRANFSELRGSRRVDGGRGSQALCRMVLGRRRPRWGKHARGRYGLATTRL